MVYHPLARYTTVHPYESPPGTTVKLARQMSVTIRQLKPWLGALAWCREETPDWDSRYMAPPSRRRIRRSL